jgi:C4-dicarboxylate transporter DctM subunit
MGEGGISHRLVDFCDSLVGHLTGGLAYVAILACMIFAAISGSGPATVAALGSILIPGMIAAGYPAGFATACLALAGAIGVIIPPSIPMVVYASVGNTSVGNMFIAGFGPGIMVGLALMLGSFILCKRGNFGLPTHKRTTAREKWHAFKEAFWALLMPVIILGGIYSGLFTPTEAAAVAVFYGIIVSALVYRNLDWKSFKTILYESASSTASILFLVANAHIFSYLLSAEQIPQKLAYFMTGLTTNPTAIMFMIMVVLLIAGCFLDNAVAVILLTPIFVTVVQALNIDICYFGVFLVFVLAIGQVTPPVGLCLFVACDIGKVSIESISKEVVPYIIGLVLVAVLLVFFPQIIMWLPSLTGL